MDGGAWWAAVHGVAKSWTRLNDFTFFTFHFPALEKEMATHSSVLAWRIPGTGEPGGLPSMGSHRIGHDWSDLAAAAAARAQEETFENGGCVHGIDYTDGLVCVLYLQTLRCILNMYSFFVSWVCLNQICYKQVMVLLLWRVVTASPRVWMRGHPGLGVQRVREVAAGLSFLGLSFKRRVRACGSSVALMMWFSS